MSYKTEPDNRAGLLTSQIFEFHISRKAREYFKFDETLFTLSGDLIFPNVRAAQAFAARMNEANKAIFGKNSSPVSSGDLNAMGVYHEVVHFVINSYVSQVNPAAFLRLENWLRKNIGAAELERSTRKFVELFPATPVYRGEEAAENYLSRSVGTLPNRHVAMTELILLWLENRNPSFTPILPLIDDGDLNVESKYNDIVSDADNFFDTQPRFPYVSLPLLKMLRAPAEAYPNSISEQLQFMAKHWEKILNKSPYLLKLLTAVDIIKEEGKYFLMLDQARSDKNKIPRVAQADFFGFGEKESQAVLRFKGHEYEAENFSQDLGWMPRVVLIAKNAFVWLDQLGRKYGRAMTRLDQIPDEELDILASRGFTGLWLIGIWTRSFASQRIKQFNGNSDAIASAYSLNSYDIASDLGGYEAYGNLKDRAFRYGIRLASDMVPNHMGIDSAWVINHPDWFLSSEYPPFPNYTFNGPDLSNDDRVGIFIEDGYWSKRDAAVVFKRLDRWTGDVRYIYHGNDGTHMPWNDTAQLDFTNPEVREAVIQTIVHVARMFPIIRFDAAMVLSKKHYQRLWFPEPGTGGSIPSRANFSMTKDQFDAAIPNEFWREVVDRVQKEVPDTL
ncbi:MAG: alpha-amylase family glycosyl hydrolase, partial [Candidatus Kryptoniota bacterium]